MSPVVRVVSASLSMVGLVGCAGAREAQKGAPASVVASVGGAVPEAPALPGAGSVQEEPPVRARLRDPAEAEFVETLERLRQNRSQLPGELVSSPQGRSGSAREATGNCTWKVSSSAPARVTCTRSHERLEGLVAVRLGTTNPALPFSGGGAPRCRLTLSVAGGSAWLYVRESFDHIAIALQISRLGSNGGVSPKVAETYRQPHDTFDGYRRVLATPAAPAAAHGSPTLLGSSVVVWVEAPDEPALGATLDVRPTS